MNSPKYMRQRYRAMRFAPRTPPRTSMRTSPAAVQESFSENNRCIFEVTRTYRYRLECISERRFFVHNNSSDVPQFAGEGCVTVRKCAKLSEGDSQNGLEHHCQQPGYPQR